MATVNFPDILNQLKTAIINLAQATLSNYVKSARKDAQALLNAMKDKLEKWTDLLASGALSTEDFEWLVYSQKDIVEMTALKEAGLAQIRIDQFRGSVINLIIDTVFSMVKV